MKRNVGLITALVAIIVMVGAGVLHPLHQVSAAAATNPGDVFGMSVLEFLLWLVAPTGLLGYALAFLMSKFQWPAPWPDFVTSLILAVFGAIVQVASTWIPPDILNLTVGAGVILLLQVVFGWAGQRVGVYHSLKLVKSVYGDAETRMLAAKIDF